GTEVGGGGGETTNGIRSADDLGIWVCWLACSKTWANSSTVAKRCLGSLARALNTTCSTSFGNAGNCSWKGGGGVMTCCTASSTTVPEKGRLIAANLAV